MQERFTEKLNKFKTGVLCFSIGSTVSFFSSSQDSIGSFCSLVPAIFNSGENAVEDAALNIMGGIATRYLAELLSNGLLKTPSTMLAALLLWLTAAYFVEPVPYDPNASDFPLRP